MARFVLVKANVFAFMRRQFFRKSDYALTAGLMGPFGLLRAAAGACMAGELDAAVR